MSKVFAQIIINLELDELSVSGTLLDLKGLASVTREHLEKLPMTGPQLRVLEAYTPTKDWQIGAQLALNQPFSPEG